MKPQATIRTDVQQSACPACYKGSQQHMTFADCWAHNSPAHMFPDSTKMQRGSFKCCYISILGASGQQLQDIKRDINLYSKDIDTLDIVTAVELGFNLNKSVFYFEPDEKVTVVNDPWRYVLNGATGVIQQITNSSSMSNLVLMNDILEKDIRVFTKNTPVWIDSEEDHVLHQQRCQTIEQGGLDGFCTVTLTDPPPSMLMPDGPKTIRIPTMLLKKDTRTRDRGDSPCDTWTSPAEVRIFAQHMVLSPDMSGNIPFTGDNPMNNIDHIKTFDPLNKLTPKIFATFYKNGSEWTDMGQKKAVVNSLCQAHLVSANQILQHEILKNNCTLHFGWSCNGVQSVFSGMHAEDIWHYVTEKNTITEPARLGRIMRAVDDYSHNNKIIVHWEDCTTELKDPNDITVITRESAQYIVNGSRVVIPCRRNIIGTVDWTDSNNHTCGVIFDDNPNAVVIGDPNSLSRHFLTRDVFLDACDNNIARVRKIIAPSDTSKIKHHGFTLLDFRGSPEGNRIGKAWICTKELADDHLRHKITAYINHPTRLILFTVQERVGQTIRSLSKSKKKIAANTLTVWLALARAVAVFCRGVAKMHQHGWVHTDAHSSNTTLTGPNTHGEFIIKLIDFDRLRKESNKLRKSDCRSIVESLLLLFQCITCFTQENIQAHEDFQYAMRESLFDMTSYIDKQDTKSYFDSAHILFTVAEECETWVRLNTPHTSHTPVSHQASSTYTADPRAALPPLLAEQKLKTNTTPELQSTLSYE